MEQKPCGHPDWSVAGLDNERIAGGKNLVIHQNPKKAEMKLRLYFFLSFRVLLFLSANKQ